MNTDELFNDDDGLQEFRTYMSKRDEAFAQILTALQEQYDCALEMTCEACPVQIEGTIDGYALYFRSRWDTWRLAIAPTLDEAVAAGQTANLVFYHEGSVGDSGFDASWLEPEQLEIVLGACLAAYRADANQSGRLVVQQGE
jgi:hypothetical protein